MVRVECHAAREYPARPEAGALRGVDMLLSARCGCPGRARHLGTKRCCVEDGRYLQRAQPRGAAPCGLRSRRRLPRVGRVRESAVRYWHGPPHALVTGKLTPHGCSSERLYVYVFVSACACVLCRFDVYHLDHQRLRYLLGCRSLLDGGYVPSKTSVRICICTQTPPHPTPHTPHKRTGRCSSTGPGTRGDEPIGAARPTEL